MGEGLRAWGTLLKVGARVRGCSRFSVDDQASGSFAGSQGLFSLGAGADAECYPRLKLARCCPAVRSAKIYGFFTRLRSARIEPLRQ